MKKKEIEGEKEIATEETSINTRDQKRTRRSKKIKKKLENFKILYLNIRGIKKKQKSLREVIREENPTIIALAETLLEGKEEIELDGYKVIPKNINEEGGRGILIAVKDEIEHITKEVMVDQDPGEQMWIKNIE